MTNEVITGTLSEGEIIEQAIKEVSRLATNLLMEIFLFWHFFVLLVISVNPA